jgi:MFS family permease
MAGGIIASGLSIAVIYNNMFANVLVSIVLGISAGIGLPSCLACFADITHIENRGLYGGIVWSTIGISTLVLVVLLTPLDAIHSFAALALWRTLGLIAFYSLSRRKREVQLGLSSISYGSIINKRAMILYLLPWIMFSLVNFIEAPVLENIFGELVTIIGFVEFGLSSISAIIGGFLSDIVGRKRVVIAGFIMLGVEYAVLGLYRQMEFSRYVYMVFDGFTWGMFASVFFMTIWGDLGEYSQKDKFYAIGGLPYLLATFLPILIRPYVGMMEPVASFSLASFFLFSAVFPLMYAPETLSEKKIKEFELRSYIKKAKKLKERLD